MTTRWKWIMGLLLLVLSFCTGWVVNSWRLSADAAAEKLETVQDKADHFRGVTKRVNDSANEYLRNTEQLKRQIAELKKELPDAKKNHPVPADCRPDSNRLRVIKDAVTAANTAAGQ